MQNNKLILPLAIVIAGVLIAGAVIYSRNPSASGDQATAVANQADATPKTADIKPVTSADHILGNANAKVLVVEYSDTECPFCKLFHVTLTKIIDTYGKDGDVAWVYRQFPIPSLHPKAPKEAEATECVNQIAGNDIFWKYLSKIYSTTPSNNGLDAAQLPILATQFGVDKKAVQTCLDNNVFTEKIQADYNDAVAAGGQGTPYTVLVSKTSLTGAQVKKINDVFTAASTEYKVDANKLGYITADKKVVFNGNLPYDLIQQIIAAMIS